MDAVIARLRKDIETLRGTTDSVSYHAKDKDQLADDIEKVLNRPPSIFLLTYGTGEDGHEWGVHSVWTTRELAEKAQEIMDQSDTDIEEWSLNIDEKHKIDAKDFN